MQFSTSRYKPLSAKASPSPRLLTYRPMASIEYSPYLEDDKPKQEKQGIFRKVTSTIGGVFKDIGNTVGGFFRPHKEEEIRLNYSQPLMRHDFNKDIVSVNLQNHPINQVNFSDLGRVLSNSEIIRPSQQIDVSKVVMNGMNLSFGGQNKNFEAEFVNQTIISFHPQESFNSKSV